MVKPILAVIKRLRPSDFPINRFNFNNYPLNYQKYSYTFSSLPQRRRRTFAKFKLIIVLKTSTMKFEIINRVHHTLHSNPI